MRAKIIDGKSAAALLRQKVALQVAALKETHGIVPGLAVILVGGDPASQLYVRSKQQKCAEVGINSYEYRFDEAVSEAELLALIAQLNQDDRVDGILVQLPLPKTINTQSIINAVSPAKDVDGFHISNVGRLSVGQEAMIPCTPLGCIMLLRAHCDRLSGLNAVVVGRSNIVGKPMANLLLAEDCTVTIAHSRSNDLPAIVRGADIVVAAVGRAEIIKGSWIKPGAVIIDVGINRVQISAKERIVGDVEFSAASDVAGMITPVPGGVGPMTIACLLANSLTACRRRHGLKAIDGDLAI